MDTLPGAIVGYRAMIVGRGKLKPLGLYPVAVGEEPWVAGVNKARCKKGEWLGVEAQRHEEERIPIKDCGCGFWGFKRLRDLKNAGFDSYGFAVNCIIAGWGKIVEHEIGFRCEYARPLAIIEPLERGITREELVPFDIPVVSIAEVPTIIEGFQLDALRVEEAEEEEDRPFSREAIKRITAIPPIWIDPKSFVKGSLS